MIEFIEKFKTWFFVLFVIIFAIGVWAAIHIYKEQPSGSGAIRLFSMDFLGSISKQVTRGLPFSNVTSPAQVTLEELGEISPVAGMVTIEKDTFTIQDRAVSTEYITIHASRRNAQAINISNWSLQSMITDTWIGIPQGTSHFTAGVVNEVEDILLEPGDTAIIATTESPIGVSFKVNECSGFKQHSNIYSRLANLMC